LIEIVDVIARHTGHEVAVWALATMVNGRVRFAQEILGEVQRHFVERTFKTVIRNNIRLREAASHGLPITEFDPLAKGAMDYMALAQEVVGQEVRDSVGVMTEIALPSIPEIEAQKFLGPILIEEIIPDPSNRSVL
jgi:hypothetical protein